MHESLPYGPRDRIHTRAIVHALGLQNAAVVRHVNGAAVVSGAVGATGLSASTAALLLAEPADLIVGTIVMENDAFAAALAADGIAFFAAARIPSEEPGFVCAFDATQRTLSSAGRYLLKTFASSISLYSRLDELQSAQRELAARQALCDERLRLLESVVVNANDAVLITDFHPLDEPGPQIRYANAAFTRMTGWTLDDVFGKTPRIFQGPQTSAAAKARLRAAMHASLPLEIELINYRKDGTSFNVEISIAPVADETGQYTHWVSVQRDVTHRRAAEEQQTRARIVQAEHAVLAHRAYHDDLTGLNNRAFFVDRLATVIGQDRSLAGKHAAVLFIDFDRFKLVNDSLGHAAGDQLLVEIGRLLSSCVRTQDLLARFGGDEFAVLVEDVMSSDDIRTVAERILHGLRDAIPIGGQDVFPAASIGIAYVDERHTSPQDILHDADAAMYRAKRNGGMCYVVFDASMSADAAVALHLQGDLRRAVERGEFVVFNQPIVDASSGSIVAIEALVRWQHPLRGLVAPADFITVAEDTGLIGAIGTFVLRESCERLRVWHAHNPALVLNVNVSARQLYDRDFLPELVRTLDATQIDPRLLQLEITESVFLERVDYVGRLLGAIRELGVRVALDDFGTGYSSLSYLEEYRVDTLKIDRAFTQRITESPVGFAIIRTIVDLARALQIKVVAEGVETREQLEALRTCGCDSAQGFLFSRPLSSTDIAGLLARSSTADSPSR